MPFGVLVDTYDAADPRNWEPAVNIYYWPDMPFGRWKLAVPSAYSSAHLAEDQNGLDHPPL